MIFYKNEKKHKKTSEKSLIFSIFDAAPTSLDDSVGKPNACKSLFNIKYEDGALKTGMGFKDLKVPESLDDLTNCHPYEFEGRVNEIHGLYVHKILVDGVYDYHLIMIDEKCGIWRGYLLDVDEGYIYSVSKRLKSKPTCICNYRIENQDCSLFFSETGMLHFSENGATVYANVPAMISCVVHYDKFFGIKTGDRGELIYTNDLNILNWTDTPKPTIEFLDNRGSFTKLVTFNDYVYLFREYGITKLSVYTSKSDFAYTHLYTSSSKIFEDTICICGENILFATNDGLYAFSGSVVKKINSGFDDIWKHVDNTNASAACLDGKYYLATKCNFDDGAVVGCESGDYVNNVLFQIDVNSYHIEIYRGVDVRQVCAINVPFMHKLCACFYGAYKQRVGELTYDGETFEVVNEKCWQSLNTDLGYSGKRKRLKEIVLSTQDEIEVQIVSDEETKNFHFKGSDKVQRQSVCVYGKIFKFTFKTTKKLMNVKKPVIVFDVA